MENEDDLVVGVTMKTLGFSENPRLKSVVIFEELFSSSIFIPCFDGHYNIAFLSKFILLLPIYLDISESCFKVD